MLGKFFCLFIPIWDMLMKFTPPLTAELKHRIEAVQRNGAQFIMGDYHQRSSMAKLLLHLKWDTLESRRLLFQFTDQVALKPLSHFSMAPCRTTRNSNSKLCLNLEDLALSNFHSPFRLYPFRVACLII